MTRSRNVNVSPDGVALHDSIASAPDEYVFCMAYSHGWQQGPVIDRPGYGSTVTESTADCGSCKRRRRDVLHARSFELLTRAYTGGHRLRSGYATKSEWRAEWFRRVRAKAAEATRRAAAHQTRREQPPAATPDGDAPAEAVVAAPAAMV